MKAVLDSGAEMSVVPAHVVPPSAYMGGQVESCWNLGRRFPTTGKAHYWC